MEHETNEVGAPAVTPGRATLVQTAPDTNKQQNIFFGVAGFFATFAAMTLMLTGYF